MNAKMMLLLLLLLPTTAFADDTVAVFGFGLGSRTSCGQFVAAMEGHKINVHLQLKRNGMTFVSENDSMMQYVYGYLTGLNLARDSAHQITNDNAAIELWLRNWCTQNPTKYLLDAAAAFAAATPGTKLQ